MLHELAERGWVCVAINYRLSPKATWPDHVVDCKRALAWVRDHIAEYGGDPSFVAVSGGSAGGHLAALVALTPNEPEWQPGFEDADTSVDACIPFYGVHDVTGDPEAERRPRAPAWSSCSSRRVMKTTLMVDTRRVRAGLARSADHLRPPRRCSWSRGPTTPWSRPRWPAGSSSGCGTVSAAPVAYLELPCTQHAFDVLLIDPVPPHDARRRPLPRGHPVPGGSAESPQSTSGHADCRHRDSPECPSRPMCPIRPAESPLIVWTPRRVSDVESHIRAGRALLSGGRARCIRPQESRGSFAFSFMEASFCRAGNGPGGRPVVRRRLQLDQLVVDDHDDRQCIVDHGGAPPRRSRQSAFSDHTGRDRPRAVQVANVSTLSLGLFKGAQVGTQAYVDYVNSTGGVNGRKLVLNGADDGFTGAGNKQATENALQNDLRHGRELLARGQLRGHGAGRRTPDSPTCPRCWTTPPPSCPTSTARSLWPTAGQSGPMTVLQQQVPG